MENVSNSPKISINTKHFTAHLISLASLASFSSRRSLGPYHVFGPINKSMVHLPSPPCGHLSQRERQVASANMVNCSINRNFPHISCNRRSGLGDTIGSGIPHKGREIRTMEKKNQNRKENQSTNQTKQTNEQNRKENCK